jgi:hypothetical protein
VTHASEVDHGALPGQDRRVAEIAGVSATERHDQHRWGGDEDEDAAAVVAILTALAASADPEPAPANRSVWADPAHRLGLSSASGVGWWSSGLPR